MLPNTGMSFTPFDPLPASDLNDLVENIEALSDGTGIESSAITSEKLATNSHIIAYVEGLTTGISTTSASLTDATGITTTFTTPEGCTRILLRAEVPISCGTDGVFMNTAITNDANTVQVQRGASSSGANAGLIETVPLSRRITVTENTEYTFKLRYASNGTATVVINNGNVATRPTCLWVERA